MSDTLCMILLASEEKSAWEGNGGKQFWHPGRQISLAEGVVKMSGLIQDPIGFVA